MKRAQGVAKRPGSAVWQWAIKAPSDLRHLYPSQWAHRTSLDTTDLQTANERAAVLRAEWLGKFATQRRALNPVRVEAVTPALVDALIASIRREILADDDAMRFDAGHPFHRAWQEAGDPESEAGPDDGLSPLQVERLAQRNADFAQAYAKGAAAGELWGQAEAAERHAKALGVAVAWNRPENRPALVKLLRATAAAWQDRARRDAGDIVNTPAPVEVQQIIPAPPTGTSTHQATKGHTPADAYAEWDKAKPGRPVKTLAAFKSAADKLAAHLNGKPLESMTRQDGRDFVAALLATAQTKGGTAQNTAVNILSRCKTLLAQAVDLEWIDRNPLQGRTIERVKATRKPWTPADLVKLFDDPLFTRYTIPAASMAGKDAGYWLPLLGLYTGARITELAQLGIDDLRQEDGAGWVLSIHEEGEGQSVKNQHSVRKVPVHPELIRLGLVEYRQAVKDAGATRLWPAVVFTELNGAGGKVSQWFGKYKTVKGFGPDHVFHSFRHTLETALRALDVPRYHIDALAGHAGSAVSDDYAHPTPAVLRPHLERLTFPGLDLPRVYTAPAWKPEDRQRSNGTAATPRRTATAKKS